MIFYLNKKKNIQLTKLLRQTILAPSETVETIARAELRYQKAEELSRMKNIVPDPLPKPAKKMSRILRMVTG